MEAMWYFICCSCCISEVERIDTIDEEVEEIYIADKLDEWIPGHEGKIAYINYSAQEC